VEVVEHALHRSQHQLFLGDKWGVEVAITSAAGLLFHQEAFCHEIADGRREGAGVKIRQMALKFNSGAAPKLPQGVHDLVFAGAEYFEEAFGCHRYGFTASSRNHKKMAPSIPQAPAIMPKVAETNHNSPKIAPTTR
jgi:hypothetical protein